eukprot:TRINITY_DN3042_c0_g1_i1.p1 TRINITY_DN3042_c0_g1~~TRINITY_DN3042_c0_g1_i1.p1  ORF type:complete len:384 (-),score=85.64 TRINITY_DN3042_c0_g1_i1:32-1141(-)
MSSQETHHFWLRDEVKPGERRTPILPEHAAKLIARGHRVSVEESRTRCVSNDEYAKVGCQLVPTGSWTSAPTETLILGLKELPDQPEDLAHRHLYFAHAFKNQTGWKELLARFVRGNGFVWDLEFLTDASGRRVAAFGRCAGYIGMAAGFIAWCHQHTSPGASLPSLEYHNNFRDLSSYVKNILLPVIQSAGRAPKVMIIGALGRCGTGAREFIESLDLNLDVQLWDMAETAKGGPFSELLDCDIVLNAIYLTQKIPPFVTMDGLAREGRRLSVVVDVSCDPNNPANPLPIYSDITTIEKPTLRVVEGDRPVDVIAIDHLPSLVPLESSKEFADALIAELTECGNTDVWTRAKKIYDEKSALAKKELQI